MPPRRINIMQGEHCVMSDPQVIITTLLGSCVAVCLYDSVAHVGGMNHFLLPQPRMDTHVEKAEMQRYGVHAMELLINEMMKQGAARPRLRAHLYGGANIFSGLGGIGTANGDFARQFMTTEGIPIGHAELGGRLARKVEFQPYEGKVRSSVVADTPAPVAQPLPVKTSGGDLELF